MFCSIQIASGLDFILGKLVHSFPPATKLQLENPDFKTTSKPNFLIALLMPKKFV